jgi:copper chaperone CopZ
MTKIEITVKDMNCAACQNSITKKLKSLEGVKKVSTDFETKKVIIDHENPNLCQDDVTCAIEDMGYHVQVP